MHKQKIYLDTSVIGGCFDIEFLEYSNRLFDAFEEGLFIAIISDITLNELLQAPEKVRNQLKIIPENSIEYVQLSEEAGELAQKYIESGVLNRGQLADAQHIAIATVEKVDVIATWNFKHIVNLRKIRGFNSVNIREGYQTLEIRTPREVIENDED